MDISPGSILNNTQTNEDYGVLVNSLPNDKILLFRIQDKNFPVFSKIKRHPYIGKLGHINENQNQTLKNELLKYYRSKKLGKSEENVLRDLMVEAFPLGIPEYQPDKRLPDEFLRSQNLTSKIQPGRMLYINTPKKSSLNDLDGKGVYVISKTPSGIWVVKPKPNIPDSQFQFLFYQDPEIPTFSGISRVQVKDHLDDDEDMDNIYDTQATPQFQQYQKLFKEAAEKKQLNTCINHEGENVTIDPETLKVIFPVQFREQKYDIQNDCLCNEDGSKMQHHDYLEELDKVHNSNNNNNMDNSNDENDNSNRNDSINDTKFNKDDIDEDDIDEDDIEFERKRKMYRNLDCDEDDINDCGDDYDFDDDNDYDFDEIRKIDLERLARHSLSGGGSTKSNKTNKKTQKKKLEFEFDIDEKINQSVVREDFEDSFSSSDMESISYFDDDSFEFNFETENSISRSSKDSKSLSSISSKNSVSSFDSDEEFEEISDLESDFEIEEEIELDEEDIEVVDIVQRGEIIERKEEDRVYKESIQTAELFKMKIEETPFYFRNNELVIKNIKKEINKIIDLKNKNTSYFQEEEEFQLRNNRQNIESDDSKSDDSKSDDSKSDQDLNAYQMNAKISENAQNNRFMADKPLMRKYLSGDYSNNYLIPIILSNKKIYNNSKSKSGEDIYDSNTHFIRNFLQETETINQFLNKKKGGNVIDQDTIFNNIISNLQPYKSLPSAELGYMTQIGKHLKDNIKECDLDILALRFCDTSKFICQSFENISNNVDFQVILGPFQKYSSKELQDNYKNNKLLVISEVENKRIGESINIVGYLRLPIKEIHKKNLSLDNLLSKYETIELKVGKDEIENPFNHPDKNVIYSLPREVITESMMTQYFDIIIPNLSQVLDFYKSHFKDLVNINQLSPLLDIYGYHESLLSQEEYQPIVSYQNKNIEKINKIADKKKEEYQKGIDKRENQKISKRSEILMHGEKKDSPSQGKSDKKVITQIEVNTNKKMHINNEVLEELEKIFDIPYNNKDTSLDTDENRFQWINQHKNMGDYFYYFVLFQYYQRIEVDKLKDELSKELISAQTQLDIVSKNTEKQNKESVNFKQKSKKCSSLGKTRIVRYPNMEALQKDNGKQITDKEGNIIMEGDYAIMKEKVKRGDIEKEELAVFMRRVGENKLEVWERKNKNVLYQLIEKEKQVCSGESTFDLKEEACSLDENELQCVPDENIQSNKELEFHEKKVESIKEDLQFINSVNKNKTQIEKEIKKLRSKALKEVSRNKRHQQYLQEIKKKEDNALSDKIYVPQKCLHDKALETFFKFRNLSLNEEYRFAEAILNKFMNIDIDYNPQEISDIDDENWTMSNVCNERLLCQHYLLGVEQLKRTGEVDEEEIISIYGLETNETLKCRVCGQHFISTETRDVGNIVRVAGKQGIREMGREVIVKDKEIEVDPLQQYLEDLDDIDLFKAQVYYNLKNITQLQEKIIKSDDIVMVNFLKSFDFIEKNNLIKTLLIQSPNRNPKILIPIAEIQFKRYLIFDIAARFLIMLQTSSQEYIVTNKFCSTNYYGYPILPNIEEDSGINMIICLLKQLSKDVIYKKYLTEKEGQSFIRNIFIKRLKNIVESDELVKYQISKSLDDKNEKIDRDYLLEISNINTWVDFRPPLNKFTLDWEPDRKMIDSDIGYLTAKNFRKMIYTNRQNIDYNSIKLMKLINYLVLNDNNEIRSSCCINKLDDKYQYINYFTEKDSQISQLLQADKRYLKYSNILNKKIERSMNYVLGTLLEKPSIEMLDLNLNEVNDEEIKQIYLNIIESGSNQGEPHLFDIYGRCLISNQLKSNIISKNYNKSDYHKIINVMGINNKVEKSEETVLNIEDKKYYNDYIDSILEIIKSDKIKKEFIFLHDILHKLKEAWESNDNKKIIKIWASINSEIQKDINFIIDGTTSDKKVELELRTILNNISNYDNLYQDYDAKVNEAKESNYFRYKKKEKDLKSIINLLGNCVSQIKNKKIYNSLSKDSINPKFKFLYSYKNQYQLFAKIHYYLLPIIKISKLSNGKYLNKHINPENNSILFHYLLVIIIRKIVHINQVAEIDGDMKNKVKKAQNEFQKEILKEVKIKKEEESKNDNIEDSPRGDIIESKAYFDEEEEEDEFGYVYKKDTSSGNKPFNPYQDNEDISSDSNSNSNSNSNINSDESDEEDYNIKEDSISSEIRKKKKKEQLGGGKKYEEIYQQFDLVANINQKLSNINTIVVQFIFEFLNEVYKKQLLYDMLTKNKIEKIVAAEDEKKRRKNLDIMKQLKYDEKLQEQHKLVMIQLQFKQIEYKDLYKIGEEILEMNIDENLLTDLDEDNDIDARDQFQLIDAGDDMDQFDANQMNIDAREEYENELMEIDNVYDDEEDEPPDDAFIL